MKADLHVHSRFSERPAYWLLRRLGCNESYTEPANLYRLARQRGMAFVTITDHNSIDGCLAITHLPGTFISEEVTSYFPDDRCKAHVLTYDITEQQHREIQNVRENVVDLVAYLRAERIVHALAHPLFSVNDKLTADHVERLLLLFEVLEINGEQEPSSNQCVREIAQRLTPDHIDRLANKHDLEPVGDHPWRKTLVGGSDDHSSLYIARAHTEVEGAASPRELLDGIAQGRAKAVANAELASARAIAHGVYGIVYQYYRQKAPAASRRNGDVLSQALDWFLTPQGPEERSTASKLRQAWNCLVHSRGRRRETPSVVDMLRREVQRLVTEDRQFAETVKQLYNQSGQHDAWFHVVNRVSSRVFSQFSDHVLDCFFGGDVFDLFHSLGSAGALYCALAPYFFAFSLHGRERRFSDTVRQRLLPQPRGTSPEPKPTRVAHFTDTFDEVNGVALTLRQQIQAARRLGMDYTVITCADIEGEGIRRFAPIGVHDLPEYPEMKLFYPPFLEMLDHCHNYGTTHIHIATPGPIGLAGLAIARILQLPTVGTYHTALPQYAAALTEDGGAEDLTWRYVVWFCNQLDMVLVPSDSTATELIDRGVTESKIHFFPRGVNVERFHPRQRDLAVRDRYHALGATSLLYVGRISKEKNLPLLADVFKTLHRQRGDLALIVVGDGPYLDQMRRELSDTPAIFTGYLTGDELATTYASCDLFVFPSTTDTFGNVVLEAQASGTPVVVTDIGGPQENMLPGITGLVAHGNSACNLAEVINTLADDPETLAAMRTRARCYMEQRSFDHAFKQTWNLYHDATRIHAARGKDKATVDGPPLHDLAGATILRAAQPVGT